MILKRILDLLLATVAAVILLPIALVVTIAIWLRMGGPVFFRQKRVGYRERIFEVVKFRTMNDARDARGNLLSDEERLGVLGAWIRRTSLDEIPQLWNIFRGDMSIVGPRPLHVHYLPLYSASQRRRHEVMPGLTGWAQINGRNNVAWEKKLALDVWYVDHRSLWLDIKILLLTLPVVLWARDVNTAGFATAPSFQGSSEAASHELAGATVLSGAHLQNSDTHVH